jgi:hypothetical protein
MEVSIDPSLQKEIFARLDVLGSKLGVAAGHMYSVLVRQQIVGGVTDAAAAAFFFFVSGWGVYFVAKSPLFTEYPYPESASYDERSAIDKKEQRAGYMGAVFGVAGLIALLIGLCCCGDAISELLNPEYGAIKELLSVIGK